MFLLSSQWNEYSVTLVAILLLGIMLITGLYKGIFQAYIDLLSK